MYPELCVYRKSIFSIRPHIWWSLAQIRPYYSRKISAVAAVLLGCQPKSMQCNIGKNICKLCNARAMENSKHVLLKCEALSVQRTIATEALLNSMPLGMKTSFSELADEEKVVFILSGLKRDIIIDEWVRILFNIVDYVYAIYNERKRLYDDLE